MAIIGCGKIGESLLRGLLSSDWRSPGEIVVTARREERVRELADHYGVEGAMSNTEAVAGAALIVIAVKPQDFDGLLGEIGGLLTEEQTVLSVAAAIPTAYIEKRIAPRVPVVRAMPNAPCSRARGDRRASARARTPTTRTSRSPRRCSGTSATPCACPRRRWTRSRPCPARARRTSPCSPRR